MPLTSIIIATYNRPHLLPRTVASAHEAGDDVEVVVVDDASTDDTASVCKQLSNIKYVRLDRNQGVAGARNVGLLESSGELCSFLDDDDVRLPNSLAPQVQELTIKSDAALVYGQALIADVSGTPTDDYYPRVTPQGNIFWQLVQQNFIPCGSAVFRRSSVLAVGLLDDAVPGVDDWDLWVRMSEIFDVAAVDHPVMVWRRSDPRSGQGSSDAMKMVKLAKKQFRRWMNLPAATAATPSQRRAARRAFSENIAAHLVSDAGRSFKAGKQARAVGEVWSAMLDHPHGVARLARRRRTYLQNRKRQGADEDSTSAKAHLPKI